MIGRALRRYFENLGEGDPIAIGLTLFALVMLVLVGIIWLVDLRRRAREQQKKKPQGPRPRLRREGD
jgi:hypothetical protein